MANQPFFFVTGMFRSGTTLLARLLNAHPELAVASDPYAPLFKAFRNQVVSTTELGQAFDPEAPLSDYYFSLREQVFYHSIQQTPLNRPFSSMKQFTLQEQVRQASMTTAPKIHPFLETLNGNTYADLIRSGINIIGEAYGDDQTKMIGFKELWASEFVPHLLEEFSDARAIIVQRDPRAVAASQNSTHEKYPWIFIARQWRKLSAIAWALRQSGFPHRDRVKLVKYEALIRRPKRTTEEICDFLGIQFHENMLDFDHFVDGSGNAWSQNSSYVRGVQAFNPDSINKWKEVLSVRYCDFIERLCWPEMGLFQYEPLVMKNWVLPEEVINHPPLIPENELADAIKSYSINSKHAYVEELRKERRRWNALTDEKIVEEEQQSSYCLSTNVYRELRAIVSKPKAGLQAPVIDDGE